jgi:hypothetical protein
MQIIASAGLGKTEVVAQPAVPAPAQQARPQLNRVR